MTSLQSAAWLAGGVFGLVALTSTAARQLEPGQPLRDPSVLRISVDLVQVDATVTDEQGRHVPDLTASDFEVLQDGRVQAISTFAYVAPGRTLAASKTGPMPLPPSRPATPDQVRRTIAIVVDDLGLSFESTVRVRNVLRRFIDNDMRHGDLVAILRTGAGMGALQQFTTDPRALHAAADRVRWNMQARVSPFGAASEIDDRLSAIENELFTAGTLGAIQYIVRGVAQLPGRKSIILLSDGFRLTDADRKYGRILDMLRSLVDSTNRAGVVIYGIDTRALASTGPVAVDGNQVSPGETMAARRAELAETQDGIGALAEETGGLFIRNTNDLAGGVRRVLDDQQGYYLLGYVPQDSTFSSKNPKFHSVSVRVKRPGLRVRSRRGFFGRPDVRPDATGVSRMVAAVTSPFAGGDIRLRLSSFFGQVEKVGPVVHWVMHVDPRDITFSEESDGTRVAQVEVLAMTFGENGQVAEQQNRRYTVTLTADRYATALESGFVYNLRVPVKRPGPYQLRIALRDAANDRIGSASHFIDVPDVRKKRLTLSSLFVEGVTAAATTDGALQDGDPNATIAVRKFRQGSEANYACYVYNAQRGPSGRPQIETEIRLFRDGTEVFRGTPRPIDAGSSADLLAGGVLKFGPETPPGSYLLQMTVTDRLAKRGGRATQAIDFDVIE